MTSATLAIMMTAQKYSMLATRVEYYQWLRQLMNISNIAADLT
jgi:hypothetical protein